MHDPVLIDGLTETQPDTATMTSRLAEVMASRPGRSQDDLECGIAALESAYRGEHDTRLRLNIKEALLILRHGPKDEDGEDSTDSRKDD